MISTSAYSTWKPPTKLTGSCTASDSSALETALNDPMATSSSIEGSVSAKCATCVFTQATSASNWQLFVWTDKMNDKGFMNVDACLKLAGVSTACATDDSGSTRCANDACNANAACASADDTTYQQCQSDASSGVCSGVGANIQTDCPSATVSSAMTKCGYDSMGNLQTFAKLVSTICG
jgi:hypothetical protein